MKLADQHNNSDSNNADPYMSNRFKKKVVSSSSTGHHNNKVVLRDYTPRYKNNFCGSEATGPSTNDRIGGVGISSYPSAKYLGTNSQFITSQ